MSDWKWLSEIETPQGVMTTPEGTFVALNSDDFNKLISVVKDMREALDWYSLAEEYPPKEITERYNTPNLRMIVFNQGAIARETLARCAKGKTDEITP